MSKFEPEGGVGIWAMRFTRQIGAEIYNGKSVYTCRNHQIINESSMKHTVEVMISEQEVQDREWTRVNEITEHYNGSEDSVLVGLLRGSCLYGGSCLKVSI